MKNRRENPFYVVYTPESKSRLCATGQESGRGKNKNPIKRSVYESHVGVTRFGSCHQCVLLQLNGFSFTTPNIEPKTTQVHRRRHYRHAHLSPRAPTLTSVISTPRIDPLLLRYPERFCRQLFFRVLSSRRHRPFLVSRTRSTLRRSSKSFLRTLPATFQRFPGRRTQGWFSNFFPPNGAPATTSYPYRYSRAEIRRNQRPRAKSKSIARIDTQVRQHVIWVHECIIENPYVFSTRITFRMNKWMCVFFSPKSNLTVVRREITVDRITPNDEKLDLVNARISKLSENQTREQRYIDWLVIENIKPIIKRAIKVSNRNIDCYAVRKIVLVPVNIITFLKYCFTIIFFFFLPTVRSR